MIASLASLVVIVAAYWLMREPKPIAPPAPPSSPAAPTQPGRPAPPFVVSSPPPLQPAVAPPPAATPPENAAPPRVQQALTSAHTALWDAARPCRRMDRRADGTQHLRFRYTLQIGNHTARATRVEKLDSDIDNRELMTCLMAALGTARWSYLGDDATLMAEEQLTLSDLDQ
jgi:hypothetical protein